MSESGQDGRAPAKDGPDAYTYDVERGSQLLARLNTLGTRASSPPEDDEKVVFDTLELGP